MQNQVDPPYEIPQSRGMPPTVRIFFAVGFAVILFMGAVSIVESGAFHIWPAQDTAKVQLPRKF